ncbi:MAG: hypothetical protein R2692_09220 [Microbacterium sp.]
MLTPRCAVVGAKISSSSPMRAFSIHADAGPCTSWATMSMSTSHAPGRTARVV